MFVVCDIAFFFSSKQQARPHTQFLVDVFGLSKEEAHLKYSEAGNFAMAVKNVHLEKLEKERALSMLSRGQNQPIERSEADEQHTGRPRSLTKELVGIAFIL